MHTSYFSYTLRYFIEYPLRVVSLKSLQKAFLRQVPRQMGIQQAPSFLEFASTFQPGVQWLLHTLGRKPRVHDHSWPPTCISHNCTGLLTWDICAPLCSFLYLNWSISWTEIQIPVPSPSQRLTTVSQP